LACSRCSCDPLSDSSRLRHVDSDCRSCSRLTSFSSKAFRGVGFSRLIDFVFSSLIRIFSLAEGLGYRRLMKSAISSNSILLIFLFLILTFTENKRLSRQTAKRSHRDAAADWMFLRFRCSLLFHLRTWSYKQTI